MVCLYKPYFHRSGDKGEIFMFANCDPNQHSVLITITGSEDYVKKIISMTTSTVQWFISDFPIYKGVCIPAPAGYAGAVK